MKRILKKTALFTVVVFIVFALVASNGMTQRTLSTQRLPIKNCSNLPANQPFSQPCIETTTVSTSPTPIFLPSLNLQLTNQQRFLTTITDKLPIIPQAGTFEYILLRAYGGAFVNHAPAVKLPPKVVFTNEQETKKYQATLTLSKVNDTNECYLQKTAADAFNQARSQVHIPLKSGYGPSDCTRSFATNLRFWQKYADSKTLEKVREGIETAILGIVAPPGSSQHLWGLAIDLYVSNQAQRQALSQHGWVQTVENDMPHWTYIGYPQEKLTEFGFQSKVVRGITYWVTPL